MARSRVAVHQSFDGWAVEIWRNNKLIHRETRVDRPSYKEKRLLERIYTEPPPVRCEGCGVEVPAGRRRMWAKRLICEDCLDAAIAPCYRWRGW